ncbi:MAG: hypothetical protein FWC20_04475 [Oscillospiraceae bacterium]|nr:hypothetical protein [Oscillospiraceae bacterium]MCL2278648.1 hypothetical protein [Oscillospiraceae bacterium]
MTFNDFYKAYTSKNEFPPRVPTDAHGSYKMTYSNGDIYEYTLKLKNQARRKVNNFEINGNYYSLYDFIHTSRWNGQEIQVVS